MIDLNDKITGGTLSAAEWNQVPSEIQNVIEGLGLTLSGADLNQLGKAITGYVANGTFYTDSGAANTKVLTVIGSRQNPESYSNGFEAEFIINTTSTAACTVNISGLGVKNITGTATAGALTAGEIARLRYNTTSGEFDIVNNTGDVVPSATETVAGIVERATQAEVDAGVDDVRYVTPLKMRFGFSILLATNGYVAFPSFLGGIIIQWGTTALLAGDISEAVSWPLVYPTSAFSVVATCNYTGGFAEHGQAATTRNMTANGFDAENQSIATPFASMYIKHISIGH